MKILLTAVNSRYIHINAAIRYLKNYAGRDDIDIMEFSTSDSIDKIEGEIYRICPDVVGFSCYIWNIEIIKKLTQLLKITMPETLILWGGPEVSYSAEDLFIQNDAVDIIIPGEGENAFKELIENISNGLDYRITHGIIYKDDDEKIIINDSAEPVDMNILPLPVLEDDTADKLVYYQSGRGCPYRCSYCLSSIDKTLRYKSIENTLNDLFTLGRRGARTIKMVDRTFNADIKRAKTIFIGLLEANKAEPFNTTYHFEMCPDLIDDKMAEIISCVPDGLFQFEIGIQSTNEETLKAVNRQNKLEKNSEIIKKLINNNNVRIHLDLIAGLPMESYKRFGRSFDDVYELRPHHLQLGFLKLLKGTELQKNADRYGIKSDCSPPYHVIETAYISHSEVLMLKDIESMVDIYYNSGHFRTAIEYIINYYESPFSFYEEIALWWRKSGYFKASYSLKQRFTKLYEFIKKQDNDAKYADVLRYAWCIIGRPHTYPIRLIPLKSDLDIKFIADWLKSDKPGIMFKRLEGLPLYNVRRMCHVEVFDNMPDGRYAAFCYEGKNVSWEFIKL